MAAQTAEGDAATHPPHLVRARGGVRGRASGRGSARARARARARGRGREPPHRRR